jgi:anoctamin-10
MQAFLAWLSALINGALVYLFRPSVSNSLFYKFFHQHDAQSIGGPLDTLETSIVPALFIALSASHGYIILRAVTRHILERALWMGSEEAKQRDQKERIVKKTYLKNVADNVVVPAKEGRGVGGANSPIWVDDGKAQLEKWIKTE